MLPPSATTASSNPDIGHAFPEMAVLFPSCRLAVQPHNTSFYNNGNNDPYSHSNIDHDHTNTRAVRASSTATTCSGLCSTPAATLTKPRGSTKCASWAAFCRKFNDQHAPRLWLWNGVRLNCQLCMPYVMFQFDAKNPAPQQFNFCLHMHSGCGPAACMGVTLQCFQLDMRCN